MKGVQATYVMWWTTMLGPAAKALIVASDPNSIDGFKSRLLTAIVMLIMIWYFMAEICLALKVVHIGLKSKWPIAVAVALPLVVEKWISNTKNYEKGQTALAVACVISLWLRYADNPHPHSAIEEQRRAMLRNAESMIDWNIVAEKVPPFEADTDTMANTEHGRARFFIVLLVTIAVGRLLQKNTGCPHESLIMDGSMVQWYAKPTPSKAPSVAHHERTESSHERKPKNMRVIIASSEAKRPAVIESTKPVAKVKQEGVVSVTPVPAPVASAPGTPAASAPAALVF